MELAEGVFKVAISVRPRSKETKIWKDEESLHIKVKAPAQKGKANKEIIKVLSKYLAISKSSISITSGMKSSHKYLRIECEDLMKKLDEIPSE